MVKKVSASSKKKLQDRGDLLTVLFIIAFVSIPFFIFSNFRDILQPFTKNGIFFLFGIFEYVLLFGAWKWNKIAAMGLITYHLLGIVLLLTAFVLNASKVQWVGVFGGILFLIFIGVVGFNILWIYALMKKLKLFH